MDWALAIERNSEALKGIVAALFAMLGLQGEAVVGRIPQPLHRAVLRVLRPAESAMRRLIIIAARGLVVKLPAAPPISRPMPAGPSARAGLPVPPFSSSIGGKTSQSCANIPEPGGIPRVSISTRMIPCGRRTLPRRRPMAWLMPNASAGGSRPSSWHSMICRARPGVWPAGG